MNVSVGRDRSGRLLLRPVRGLPFLWFVPRAEAPGLLSRRRSAAAPYSVSVEGSRGPRRETARLGLVESTVYW